MRKWRHEGFEGPYEHTGGTTGVAEMRAGEPVQRHSGVAAAQGVVEQAKRALCHGHVADAAACGLVAADCGARAQSSDGLAACMAAEAFFFKKRIGCSCISP